MPLEHETHLYGFHLSIKRGVVELGLYLDLI